MSRSMVPMLRAKPWSSSKPSRTRAAASSSRRASCVMGRCTSTSGNGYKCTPPIPSAASRATRPTPLDGVVEYGAGFLDDLMRDRRGPPGRPAGRLGPRAHPPHAPAPPRDQRRLLPARRARPREHPGGRALAAGRQPLRRAADRRHVRVLGGVLQPLRARSPLPPARPRRGRQEPGAGADPPLRRRPRLARQRARRLRARRAGARLPRRRLRDLPPQLARRPDRVRRPPGFVKLALEQNVPIVPWWRSAGRRPRCS